MVVFNIDLHFWAMLMSCVDWVLFCFLEFVARFQVSSGKILSGMFHSSCIAVLLLLTGCFVWLLCECLRITSLAGSGDNNSGSSDEKSCVRGFYPLLEEGSVWSIFVKSVVELSGWIELLCAVVSISSVCVIVSCFALLCSCVTYCKSLGLI